MYNSSSRIRERANKSQRMPKEQIIYCRNPPCRGRPKESDASRLTYQPPYGLKSIAAILRSRLLPRLRRHCRWRLHFILLLSRFLDRDKRLRTLNMLAKYKTSMSTQLTSPINRSPVARRSRVLALAFLSFSTSSHTLRITLSTSSFAPYTKNTPCSAEVSHGLCEPNVRTFQITLTPCSEACSSNFCTCSADKPDCSASCNFWNTPLSSIAARQSSMS